MTDPAEDHSQPLSPDLVESLATPSTATLTTVLSKRGLWNTFIEGARPLMPGARMIGRAFTLRYIPAREDLDHVGEFDNSTDPQRLAVERIGPGQVLVIDARRDARAGTMGAILATRIKTRGAEGVVTDGAFRDSPAIRKTGLAAYCRGAHAATNKTIHHPIDFQTPIACGGVAVFPGDVLVGDDEGVVVIPYHLVDEVAKQAAEMERFEDFVLEKIQAGASIVGVYPPTDDVREEYRRKTQVD